MRKTWIALTLAVVLSACTSETPLGDCIGLDDEKDPALVYDVDVRNVVVGALLLETIIVPIYVAVEEVYCPVAVRQTPDA